MNRIFISHASPDRAFVLRLARSLEELGYEAWVDAQEITVGDDIPQAVGHALDRADYLVLVLTPRSVASSWCSEEWSAKYWEQVSSRRPLILPALLEDCAIPLFLRSKRYADFRTDYAVGLSQLSSSLQKASPLPGGVLTRLPSVPPVLLPMPACYTDDTMNPPGQLVEVHVDLQVPYLGRVSGVWKPDEREQDAAWELYIELVTRVSAVEVTSSDGLLRESLSSLYSIFTTTRQLLRTYGPAVAKPKDGSSLSFGYLAITMLNFVLRPMLTKWHPFLLDYEHRKDPETSAWEHEAVWEHAQELRIALNRTRLLLLEYANLLAEISHVPPMIPELEYTKAA